MKAKEREARLEAIRSGVNNAVETVVVDKAMTAKEAWESLESFASDGLCAYGFDDRMSKEEIEFAKSCYPL